MKICNITMIGYNNFGNRLQNYAIRKFINDKFNFEVFTMWKYETPIILKNYIKIIIPGKYIYFKKFKKFYLFNKLYIKKYKTTINSFINSKKILFDYYIVGSDQVWNFEYFKNFPKDGGYKLFLLSNIPKQKSIAFAPSFGLSYVDNEYKKIYSRLLKEFKALSVREDDGKEIIDKLTGIKNVDVLIDPTMLLTRNEWNNISKKPKNYKGEKYILNYFLGDTSEERIKVINKYANDHNYKVINLLDKKDPYFVCGPSEFLWLEEHAELICTDSFHSSVFAIIFDRPFIIFDREQANIGCMNSRIETLINKFKLNDRKYNGKRITKANLEHDYSEAYKILEKERKKSEEFLKKALDIKN